MAELVNAVWSLDKKKLLGESVSVGRILGMPFVIVYRTVAHRVAWREPENICMQMLSREDYDHLVARQTADDAAQVAK